MFSFQWIWAFYLLPIPFLIRALPALNIKKITTIYVAFLGDKSKQLTTKKSSKTSYLSVLMWVCFIFALAKPQVIGEPIPIPTKGRSIQLAVDVSGSMSINDMSIKGYYATRIEAVKFIISKFIKRRVGDKIGLILFGTKAYVQSPLSFDRETVDKLLQESFIGIAGKHTAIGDAIGLAVKKSVQAKKKNKNDKQILVLITDGVNSAELNPLEAAKIAKKEGLKIYTVGVGGDSVDFWGKTTNGIDEKTLKSVAKITGGKYFRAKNTKELENIYTELDKLEPIESKKKFFRPIKDYFYLPLSAFLLLMFVYLFSARRF